ncbi:ABC transporter ATP-binding protein [Brochothrix campestris]|uniref:Sugar ABC transporter, ATP-binding protein n=1 Tax=Brochothrix campestris FSL F6-1037 TaxID=1265861 RepID=W7CR07_9LIST|nr:sn-glycerol-3-phosphate ABC transporter ATP-binding protein UgpC [Brochothrix campestris]EUJ42084.1 sugar ABC transporter, ATP-binding protein [Brochothrix campestris FSL F6-1037]
MVQMALNNIYKKYTNAEGFAVTDFNLVIEDQEFIVFVGPSGCGKSTTLRMVAGLEDISDGELYIDNKLMNDVAPKDRDIGMVFQNYALYPHMSIYDNMAFGLKLRKYSKTEIKQRVGDAAEVLGLTDYLDRKPAALSGGQRQRVALGRAIVRDAKVFLMDEPLSNLDAKLRVAMRAEIAKLHNRLKTTTIYVTHDQTEAMTMADRIVIMKDGFVHQIGSPKEVYNHPKNVFVAGFIGSPAMNFFTVTLRDGMITNDVDLSFILPEGRYKVLKARGYEGKQIIFGIRPEDLQTEQIVLDSSSSVINVEVVVSELLGAETMLYSKLNNVEFIAKVPARDECKPGDIISLAFNLNKAHFFDSETENVIV